MGAKANEKGGQGGKDWDDMEAIYRRESRGTLLIPKSLRENIVYLSIYFCYRHF